MPARDADGDPAEIRAPKPEPRVPAGSDVEACVAYRQPQPAEMAPDLLVWPVLPSDERIWVPQAPNVWFRPLCLSASQGYWVNLLKVTRAGREATCTSRPARHIRWWCRRTSKR